MLWFVFGVAAGFSVGIAVGYFRSRRLSALKIENAKLRSLVERRLLEFGAYTEQEIKRLTDSAQRHLERRMSHDR